MSTTESSETSLTESEGQPADDSPSVADPERRPAFPVRVFEWFWRGRAMAAVRSSAVAAAPRVQELHRRAQLASELGACVQDSAGPLANGTGDAIACDLYRQSIYWSLRAMRPEAVGVRDAATADPAVDPCSVWNGSDPVLLASELGDAENVALAKRALLELSFVELAELSPAEASGLARRLQHISTQLFESIGSVERALDDLFWQRIARVGSVAIVAAALFGDSLISERREIEQLEIQRDLAAGKPWKQSSRHAGQPTCVSPAQSCVESPNFFFHTEDDENPTLEFDLGEPKRFSSVRVINTACCQERAAPLVVEISNDAETWKEIARRDETFSVWKADFPWVSARYVRFRALRKTWLHFQQVRILP